LERPGLEGKNPQRVVVPNDDDDDDDEDYLFQIISMTFNTAVTVV
jgi:hypothetical protein